MGANDGAVDNQILKVAVIRHRLEYASGYVSAFMGKRIVFRETMCRSKGDPYCTIIGETACTLPDDDPNVRALHPEDIAGQLEDMADEIGELRASLRRDLKPSSLIGQSPAFLHSFNLLRRATDSGITVLLSGETGVGKEVFARWLHDNGPRRDRPFIAINCAAIPHDLIESELFGVEAGAFTGAQKARAGRFVRADGGTLFLDEIGDMPLAAQAKLLRVLQTGELEPLGGDRLRHVDVRIIAATNIELPAAVEAKQFRADLFYRLNPYPIEIPPLRERAGDIPLFVDALLERLSTRHRKPVRGLSDRAMKSLLAYSWPGNVRELENVLERGVMLAEPGGRIDVEALFMQYDASAAGGAVVNASGQLREPTQAADGAWSVKGKADLTLATIENEVLAEAMQRADGNVAEAARLLGLTRRQLDYRLRGQPTQ